MDSTFSLDDSLGVIYLGSSACSVLFGVNSVQTYYYYRHYERDGLALKMTVGLLWLLNALHMTFMIVTIYHYCIKNFMNPIALTTHEWSFSVAMTLPCLIFILVTCIYSWRIYIISNKNWFVSFVPVSLGLVCTGSGLGIAGRSSGESYLKVLSNYQTILYASYASAMICDLWIAVALCYYLLRGRSGLKSTSTLVNTLILYCVSTGALAAVLHILNLVTYATMASKNFVFIGIYVVTPELYTNALLATLNARDNLRNRTSEMQWILPVVNFESERMQSRLTNQSQSSSSLQSISFSTLDATHTSLFRWNYAEVEGIPDALSIRRSSSLSGNLGMKERIEGLNT